MSTKLSFHSTQFKIINHNQQAWLTAPQIAAALSYADQSSVNRIYARHVEEFTSCMTATVKLTDPNGDAQETRIFSLRGAHLIAMFARTPVAKEFRRWVLDVLDREVGTAVITPVKPIVRTRREEVYYENDLLVARRPIADGEMLMNSDSCFEHIMRAGFIVIPCDEVGKLTMDELWLMAEETKKLRDRVRNNFQELAARYDF